ncbi:hypothetical protein MMC22_005736 [Lobaria immixta]|nr:hypothetical protein [Lobaria immixta]
MNAIPNNPPAAQDAAPGPTEQDYALVLLDANSHVFLESMICDGERGGLLAAECLGQILRFLYPRLTKTVIHMFMDEEGLVERHREALIQLERSSFRRFVISLRNQYPHFEVQDTGTRGLRDNMIMSIILDSHLSDPHCKHVLLGCSLKDLPDILEDQTLEDLTIQRLTLRSSVEPMDEGVLKIIPKIELSGMFRGSLLMEAA